MINSTKFKKYKKFPLYKFLFNDWPEKINTSSILLSSKTLKKFYRTTNPYRWNYLAIDVQLVLFFYYKNKFEYIDEILTKKIENINNLDSTFKNIFTEIYWLRRLEQHKFTQKLIKRNYNLDYLLTLFFLKLFTK